MWEVIEGIEKSAKEAVDDRIAKWKAAEPKVKDIYALAGSFTMGLIGTPREEQIESYGLYLLSMALPDEQWREREVPDGMREVW